MSAGHGPIKYIKHAPPLGPQNPRYFTFIAKGLGATMWFWIFYRTKHDWKHWLALDHPH